MVCCVDFGSTGMMCCRELPCLICGNSHINATFIFYPDISIRVHLLPQC